MLQMRPRVKVGQSVLVVNSLTEEERLCRVVSVESHKRGRRKVAVEFARAESLAEFAHAESDFWHIYGPAVSLKPAAPAAAVSLNPAPPVPAVTKEKTSKETVPAVANG
jgi:hypothetical protein